MYSFFTLFCSVFFFASSSHFCSFASLVGYCCILFLISFYYIVAICFLILIYLLQLTSFYRNNTCGSYEQLGYYANNFDDFGVSILFSIYILLKCFAKQITNLRYLRATLQLLIEQGHEEQKLCLPHGH